MLNKLVRLGAALLLTASVNAQEVLEQVRLQRSGQGLQVQYRLRPADSVNMEEVKLLLLRRRNGAVTEVFTAPLSPTGSRQWQSYFWKQDTALIRPGDEVQARVLVRYRKQEPVRPAPLANTAPRADAGADLSIELPLRQVISLNGLRSYDEDGRIVAMRWKQTAGPTNLQIQVPDFYKTGLGGVWKEGLYEFEFQVTDNSGVTSTDRVQVNVKTSLPAAPVTAKINPQPPAANTGNTNVPVKTDTAARAPVQTTPKPAPAVLAAQPARKDTAPATVKRVYEMPKLKGGPSNAFVNLLLPGLGHYYTSGDHYGNDRKPQVLLIAALYGGAVGGAVYYKLRSVSQYNRYKDLAAFREYQRDAGGSIIGIRGASEAQASAHLENARAAQKNFIILSGVSAGILAVDFVYTFIRGLRNQKAWRADAGVSFHPWVQPLPNGAAAGVIVKW